MTDARGSRASNTHYGASHILQGVDLDVPQGRISAVLGRNGVGKTTTVKTIVGLVQPSGGRVRSTAPTSPAGRRTASARAGVGLRAGGTADLSRSHRHREHQGRRTQGRRRPGRSPGCSSCSPPARALGAAGAPALGRRAADAGDRARAGLRPQGDAARRAEPGSRPWSCASSAP